MTVASDGTGRFAPTASINPPRMMTTPLGMAAPLTGCTVPPVMANTPGASAQSGTASRQRAAMKQTDRLDILTSAAGHDSRCELRVGSWERLPVARCPLSGVRQLRAGSGQAATRYLSQLATRNSQPATGNRQPATAFDSAETLR